MTVSKLTLDKIETTDTGENAIITKPNNNASTIESLPIPIKMTYHDLKENKVWCQCWKTVYNPMSNGESMVALEGTFHLCSKEGVSTNDSLGDGYSGKAALYEGWIYLPSEARVFSDVYSVTATVNTGSGTALGASVQTIPASGQGSAFDYNKKIHVTVHLPYPTGTSINVDVNARIIGKAK